MKREHIHLQKRIEDKTNQNKNKEIDRKKN